MSRIMNNLIKGIKNDLDSTIATRIMHGKDAKKEDGSYAIDLTEYGFAPTITMLDYATMGKADIDSEPEVREFQVEVLLVDAEGDVYACADGYCEDADGYYTQELLSDCTIESVEELEKYVAQVFEKEAHDKWSEQDGVVFEVCPDCGNEVMLKAELSVQTCPICGKRIVACAMCMACEANDGKNYCSNCCLCYQADLENKLNSEK